MKNEDTTTPNAYSHFIDVDHNRISCPDTPRPLDQPRAEAAANPSRTAAGFLIAPENAIVRLGVGGEPGRQGPYPGRTGNPALHRMVPELDVMG